MKMGKTLHPTPYTLHPGPTRNFFGKPYLSTIKKNYQIYQSLLALAIEQIYCHHRLKSRFNRGFLETSPDV
ncbi:hypothetical protein [Microcystis aeruginosa]|uniref:hypothetical protein n=1 Tax=Microcystis aeruginosa TaxID=1126 RepID=UPI000A788806|nr:hypothetical protein [Microcystis aeruginosa]